MRFEVYTALCLTYKLKFIMLMLHVFGNEFQHAFCQNLKFFILQIKNYF